MHPIMNLRNEHIVPVKPILHALSGRIPIHTPFWLMRQAGRYLPEYREIRAKAGSFLDLVYNPSLAAEVTMQPLRRYGMDAAILFSDILVVPHALGRSVRFEEGEGPRLDPVRQDEDIAFRPDVFGKKTQPVMEAVQKIRERLIDEGFDHAALIGFAGAPWTVACYMVEGCGSRDFMKTRLHAFEKPESFKRLIDTVTQATIHYLKSQISAGAEVIQIFDSWAGILDEAGFRQWVIEPTKRIVSALNVDYPDVPVIGFPRCAGVHIDDYVRETGVNAISLDHTIPVQWAASVIQPPVVIQGNLDPVSLLAGGEAMRVSVKNILSHFSGRPFIFNLGHGVIKDTPPDHVAQLASILRGRE